MSPQRRLSAVQSEPERDPAPDLRDAVQDALTGMDWLTDADKGMAAIALRLAAEIEKVVDRAAELVALRRDLAGEDGALKRLKALEAQCDATKAVGWLGPQLQGVLRDLGGAPAARAAFGKDKPVGGRLAKLRAAAAGEDDS